MSTTIKDFGRHSERFGDISYYYVFTHKFWVNEHQVAPDDILSWCRENCSGYYKVTCYTHEKSIRNDDGSYAEKIVYVDTVYLQNDEDSLMLALRYSLSDIAIKRPKLARKNKKRS